MDDDLDLDALPAAFKVAPATALINPFPDPRRDWVKDPVTNLAAIKVFLGSTESNFPSTLGVTLRVVVAKLTPQPLPEVEDISKEFPPLPSPVYVV